MFLGLDFVGELERIMFIAGWTQGFYSGKKTWILSIVSSHNCIHSPVSLALSRSLHKNTSAGLVFSVKHLTFFNLPFLPQLIQWSFILLFQPLILSFQPVLWSPCCQASSQFSILVSASWSVNDWAAQLKKRTWLVLASRWAAEPHWPTPQRALALCSLCQ